MWEVLNFINKNARSKPGKNNQVKKSYLILPILRTQARAKNRMMNTDVTLIRTPSLDRPLL